MCFFLAATLVAGCGGGGAGNSSSVPSLSAHRSAASTTSATPSGTNVIADGGFESGTTFAAGWSQCGSVPSDVQIEGSIVNSGNFAAETGSTTSEPNGKAGVCQTFTVPTGATLTAFIDEVTNETSTKFADQEADLLNSSGGVIANLYTDVANTNGFVERTIDLSKYAGQTVTLFFGVSADGDSKFHIAQFIDDVAVTGTPASASPTPTPVPMGPNAIQDPGFESGGFSGGWTQCGSASSDTQIQSAVVHIGVEAAETGSTTSEPNGKAGVCQTFTVPTGATLSAWIFEDTNETSTTFADEEADLLNSSGSVITQLYEDVGNTDGFVQRTFDLSSYAGQTVTLFFGVRADGDSNFYIAQFIDDVSVTGPATSVPLSVTKRI